MSKLVSRNFVSQRIAAAIAAPFFVLPACVMVYEGDRLGRLELTKSGLFERDSFVLGTICAAGIPVTASMAGGYAENMENIVGIHFNTVRVAHELFVGRRACTILRLCYSAR
jgi:acetoin utilization deacetylase AcuC-like enzyme